MILKIATDIQKEHGFPPLATIETGYVGEGERVFYINLQCRDGERNFTLEREELELFLDEAREVIGLPASAWPDERV
jgi:hypothetical protein